MKHKYKKERKEERGETFFFNNFLMTNLVQELRQQVDLNVKKLCSAFQRNLQKINSQTFYTKSSILRDIK